MKPKALWVCTTVVAMSNVPVGERLRSRDNRKSRCRSSAPSTISSLLSHYTGKKSTRSLLSRDALTVPEVLMPKGVTMASRIAINAFYHAGGLPTVRVASTRMVDCSDALKSML